MISASASVKMPLLLLKVIKLYYVLLILFIVIICHICYGDVSKPHNYFFLNVFFTDLSVQYGITQCVKTSYKSNNDKSVKNTFCQD